MDETEQLFSHRDNLSSSFDFVALDIAQNLYSNPWQILLHDVVHE